MADPDKKRPEKNSRQVGASRRSIARPALNESFGCGTRNCVLPKREAQCRGSGTMMPARKKRTRMHSKVFLIAIVLFLLSLRINAQPTDSTSAQAGHPVIISVGAFVVGSTLSIYVHEVGHYAVGKVLGASSASIKLFPPKASMAFPTDASIFQTSFPVLAGPLSTRLSAEVLDMVLNNTSPPQWLQTLGGAWYLAMRLDLPFQILTSSIIQLGRDEATRRDDIYQGLIGPYFHSHASRNLAYIALIAVQVYDLWTSSDDIKENVHRLTGRYLRKADEPTQRVAPFYDASSGSWGICYQLSF